MKSHLRNLLAITFALVTLTVNAQVKRYFDKYSKPVKNPKNATTYIVVERSPDSLFIASRYDIKTGKIMSKDSYLDDELSFKHGDFWHYQLVEKQTKISEHQSKFDTTSVISATGYYNNGQKWGTWKKYHFNGVVREESIFSDDKENGQFSEYDDRGSLYRRGNFINGLHEGDWYLYNLDSTIHSKMVFYHERMIDQIIYDKVKYFNAYPDFELNPYMVKDLKKLGLKNLRGTLLIQFTVNEDGTIKDPKILLGVDETLDNEIISRITKSPRWIPAKQDDTPIKETVNWSLDTRSIK
jgi:antitoxin component YwqK of YwqJK toxin-antitoxin module